MIALSRFQNQKQNANIMMTHQLIFIVGVLHLKFNVKKQIQKLILVPKADVKRSRIELWLSRDKN